MSRWGAEGATRGKYALVSGCSDTTARGYAPVEAPGRSWRNPVQWSHYSKKHSGLCFGFDISAKMLNKVRYTTAAECACGGHRRSWT